MLEGMYPILLMSTGKKITTVNECEVIGYGDSPLSRFLLGRFRDQPHYVTVHQARVYAIAFIAEAKKYDGQFVGAGTDVFTLERSPGNMNRPRVSVLDAGQTGDWEKEIAIMNYWFDALFSQATNQSDAMSLDQFMEKLKAFRRWCGGEPLT